MLTYSPDTYAHNESKINGFFLLILFHTPCLSTVQEVLFENQWHKVTGREIQNVATDRAYD